MNTVIVDAEGFRKQFALTEQQFERLVAKGPPHMNIEGKLFFTLGEELIDWLNSVYRVNAAADGSIRKAVGEDVHGHDRRAGEIVRTLEEGMNT